MPEIDENVAFRLVSNYYNDRRHHSDILRTFLAILKPEAEAQRSLLKAKLSQDEMDSEVTFALLRLMEEVYDEGHAKDFQKRFVAKLRPELRRYANPRVFVDIEDAEIADEDPNPEERYIIKEQVHLIKLFLHKHFDLLAVEWFMRKYAGGERTDDIAYDYSVTRQAVNKRLRIMLPMVSDYMRKMNG